MTGVVGAGVVALAVMGCRVDGAGGDQEHVREAELPLTGGALVDAAKRPWAAFITTTYAFTPGGAVGANPLQCTGVLIAPDVVLTAAVCVVCPVGITVRFAAGGLFGLPGPVERHGVHVRSHPGTYPSRWSLQQGLVAPDFKPNCVPQTEGELLHQIHQFVEPGANVGIIRLDAPVDIPPVEVLLDPPRGFSPVQDLFEVPVTILGRGPSGLSDTSFQLMREGTTAIDFYTSRPPCPVLDFVNRERFVLWSSVNCVHPSCAPPGPPPPEPHLHAQSWGDIGGPMLAVGADGKERVIGVAHGFGKAAVDWEVPFNGNTHAPTFTLDASEFLRKEAFGLPTGLLADADGDNVADPLDNCPLDANRDQIDRDDDGVGDVCDNCAPDLRLDRFEGEPPADFAALVNPGQANCSHDAESERIRAADSSFIAPNGEVRRVTDTDYMQFFHCGGGLVGAMKAQRRGDACDPVPCARASLVDEPIDQALVAPGLCLDPGTPLGIAPWCEYVAPGAIKFRPVVDPATVSAHWGIPPAGEIGVRYCVCDDPHLTEGERRDQCGDESSWTCGISAERYAPASPDANWKLLSLASASPPVDVLTAGAFYAPGTLLAAQPEVPWRSLEDLSPLTSEPLPSPPWTITGGHIAGGPVLNGILWSHVPAFKGQPTDAMPLFDGREVVELASWYGPADHVISLVYGKGPLLDRYHPSWPWEYCAGCGFGEGPRWLIAVQRTAGCTPEAPCGSFAFVATPAEVREVTAVVPAAARALLAGGGVRVLASEPEHRLAQAGVTRREVVVAPSSLAVLGRLGVEVDRITASEYPAGATDGAGEVFDLAAAGAAGASLLAYSAIRDELFALHRAPGRLITLGRWSGATARWEPIALQGDVLGAPLALAFHVDDGALYVLDRERGPVSRVRLLRVTLAGSVAVLAPNLLGGSRDAVSLSVGEGGELLLAAATREPRRTQLARLRVRGGAVELTHRLALEGETLIGDARETEGGVAYLIEGPDGLSPRILPRASLPAVREDAVAGPVFP